MSISTVEMETPVAAGVEVSEGRLAVEIADGRMVSVPLGWYPRLVHASEAERANWELHVDGEHIRWPDLDEDVSVEALLAGKRSGESERSFERWLAAKRAGRSVAYHDLMAAKRAE